MSTPVRVRFAPSPTGFLHVGGARTALFNWLWARKNGGTFILRIEDTDLERSTDASIDQILDSLQWLGLDWDEGPFFQSQRTQFYFDHIKKLYETGKIYPAFETREEIEEMRTRAMEEKRDRIYDRRSLGLPPEEVKRRMESGVPFVWRFKVPDQGFTEVPETLLGEDATCRFENSRMDDFIITRPGTLENPGMPLFNFVCVVDDALMQITHVIRGADHLTNTARQVLIYEAMGYPLPRFTHLPLIMKNNKKMSKRDADADPRYPVSVSARRDLGYLREATINFLALLGWSSSDDREIYPVEDLIAAFSLDRLSKSNANFDEDKYLHQNGLYIRSLALDDLTARVRPFIEKVGFDLSGRDDKWLATLVELVRERCRLLSEFPDALAYMFAAPDAYEAKGVKKFFADAEAAALLEDCAEIIGESEPFTKETMEGALRTMGDARGLGFGKIAQPIRLAVTGRTASPGLFEIIELLGRNEAVARIRTAAGNIRGGNVPTTP